MASCRTCASRRMRVDEREGLQTLGEDRYETIIQGENRQSATRLTRVLEATTMATLAEKIK